MGRAAFFRATAGAALLALASAGPLAAQASRETLADIRGELSALSSSIQALRGELVASSARQPGLAGGSAIERMDLLERELQRLTSRTEELGHRIDQVVRDATNRIGDLEFRLTEIEGGDPGATPAPAPLGGAAAGGSAAGAPPARPSAGASTQAASRPELAVGERGDFDRARGVLGQGDFRTAADLFAAFAETYPGGELTGEAHVLRGDALLGLGDTLNAARAYLQSYSGWPAGERAPEALLKLGTSLGALGETADACTTLAQVAAHYPDAPAVAEATVAQRSLGCH